MYQNNSTEEQIQQAFVAQMAFMHRKDVIVSHTANEGKIPVQYRMKLKRMGLFNGFPDITIIWGNKHGYLEFKSKKGTLTDEQKWFQAHCKKHDIPHAVPRSAEQAMDALREWGVL